MGIGGLDDPRLRRNAQCIVANLYAAKFNENEVHKCLVMFDTLAG